MARCRFKRERERKRKTKGSYRRRFFFLPVVERSFPVHDTSRAIIAFTDPDGTRRRRSNTRRRRRLRGARDRQTETRPVQLTCAPRRSSFRVVLYVHETTGKEQKNRRKRLGKKKKNTSFCISISSVNATDRTFGPCVEC